MKTRKTLKLSNPNPVVNLLMAISFVSILNSYAFSSEIPKGKPDFASLSLKVTDIRVEDKIEEKGYGKTATIGAKEGYKLVIITLEAVVPSKTCITYSPSSFLFFYEYETVCSYGPNKGQKEIDDRFSKCCAVNSGAFGWTVISKDGVSSVKQVVKEGPLKIEIAAIVPEKTQKFSVIIPTLAKGEAKLPDTGTLISKITEAPSATVPNNSPIDSAN